MRRVGAASGSRAATPRDAADDASGVRGPKPISLRARALGLLATREHSASELTRKLAAHAESAEQVEALVGELASRGLLSDHRFAESLIRRRSQRYGLRRIERELDQHAISSDLLAPLLRELANDERERAFQVWRKRFGSVPVAAAERARQQRFLAQRGFSGETIAWVLKRARDEEAASD